MLQILQNFSLKPYHTFAIDVYTRFWFEISSFEDLQYFLSNDDRAFLPRMVLGGGSNVLFTENFEGIIYHPNIRYKKIVFENEEQVLIEVGAGENWDEFVDFAVGNGWYGIENLSLIPGSAGACPVQNIGAYGVEVQTVIDSVKAYNWDTKEIRIFNKQECQFGYRNSIFKREFKDKYLILSVVFSLSKKECYNLDYSDLKEELKNAVVINLKSVRQAIIAIRKRKLPDFFELPNAGSFFKNPVVSRDFANQLLTKFPGMVIYRVNENERKLAAGWMIDQCGWKGKSIGDAGVHKNQALVLINYGNAKGIDILQLAEEIKKSVFSKFGVQLENEVNII